MKRRRLRYFALLFGILLILITVGCTLWVRTQQRQYTLNRRLIAALIQKNDQQALALVNAGADPNTRYTAPPKPSFRQLLKRLLHRYKPPVNDSPTAFLIANGAAWKHVALTEGLPENRPEDAPLVLAMLLHGADVNVRDWHGSTALVLAVCSGHANTVDVLLKHGANPNVQDENGSTALLDAINNSENRRSILHLLTHGANSNILDNEGENALYLAQKQEHPDIIALLLQYGAKHKPPDPPTSVPVIARLLGIKVGYNGQDRLERQFGKGVRSLGGHPNGTESWCTRQGEIFSDGFSYNEEGEALENVEWDQASKGDRSLPVTHPFPHNAGWLGVVYPGMSMTQASQLTAGRVPAPLQQGNTWTWTAKGFVRPSSVNYDIYTTWTAQLTFQNNVLQSIEVSCDGGQLAP